MEASLVSPRKCLGLVGHASEGLKPGVGSMTRRGSSRKAAEFEKVIKALI